MVLGLDETTSIALLSIAFSLTSFELTRRFGNRKRQKQIQREIQAFQKELKQAMKDKNDKKVKELEAREKELMKLMNELIILPFKSMILVLPIFFILITLVTDWFPAFTITLPVGLHMSEIFALNVLTDSVYGARGFFLVIAILTGMTLELAYSRLVEKHGNDDKPAAPNAMA